MKKTQGLDLSKAEMLSVPTADWRDEVLAAETLVTSGDDVVKQFEVGVHTSLIAKSALISRMLEVAPEEILNPNKLLLYSGLRADVVSKYARARRKVKVASGREYYAPHFVGPVRSEPDEVADVSLQASTPTTVDDDTEQIYITAESPEALGRATLYLQRVVPGHIWRRLLLVYTNGGDVRELADQLIDTINAMVERILAEK